MAAHRVFSINELLEAVILQMSLDSIILSTAVCSRWHDLITDSSAIRARLQSEPCFGTDLPVHSILLQNSGLAPINCDLHSPWLFSTYLTTGTLFTARLRGTEVFTFSPAKEGRRFALLTNKRRVVHYDDKHRLWTLQWHDEEGDSIVRRSCGAYSMGAHVLFSYLMTFRAEYEKACTVEESTHDRDPEQ